MLSACCACTEDRKLGVPAPGALSAEEFKMFISCVTKRAVYSGEHQSEYKYKFYDTFAAMIMALNAG